MAEPFRHDLELPGCTPEPLMAYLKALGILRLVSEQKDPDARGWWRNDVFWLRSAVLFGKVRTKDGKHEALVKFFLEEYKPTPIVAPWAGGSGFFPKDNKQAVESLCSSKSPRCKAYADVIHHVRRIIENEKIGDKPKGEDKSRLIRRYRRELPDEVVAWMDAAMVLQQERQSFAPLLGTGGNDGRLDFTQKFMQRIVSLNSHNDQQPTDQSKAWLAQAFFASPANLESASIGQFAPGRAGGPNATQGFEGVSLINPWDFIFMMEGTLLLAGAAVRRFGVSGLARAAFPFTVRTVAAGFDSLASKGEAESRGELWLPLWTRPTTTAELSQLFGEGRAEVSGRTARDGVDFARAVACLGVDRGIRGFNRLGFLKRSGKAFLAAPLGRFEVVERTDVDLLREVDPWLDHFRGAAGEKKVPPRFAASLRYIDAAIFEFCKYGGAAFFQKIVIALGRAERELALTPGKVGMSKTRVSPLSGLSADWINAAANGSSEFTVARSLASIYNPEGKIGPLRANLEPVTVLYDKQEDKQEANWAEKDRCVVWNAADLPTNLTNVLQRRMMDGVRNGCQRLPLESRSTVPLKTVAGFIAGDPDDQHIERLLWGLMLIDSRRGGQSCDRNATDHLFVPRSYALLKLLFLPRPLVIERDADGAVSAHLLRNNDVRGVVIRPETFVLHLLRAERIGEACRIAMRRLRASGLDPMPKPIRGRRVRDEVWLELDHMGSAGIDPLRLAAALLIPINDNAVSQLARLVIRGNDIRED